MREQLEKLLELQELEQRKKILAEKRNNITTGSIRSIWQEICVLGREIEVQRKDLMLKEKNCRIQEAALAQLTEKTQRMEIKLYDGNITNIKELEQMRERYEVARQEMMQGEDTLLHEMELCEMLTASIDTKEGCLKKKKIEHREKQQEILQVISDMEAQINKAIVLAAEIRSCMNASVLQAYGELARKIEMPVAKVSSGVCSGCHRSLPIGCLHMSTTELIFCDNCGRILVAE